MVGRKAKTTEVITGENGHQKNPQPRPVKLEMHPSKTPPHEYIRQAEQTAFWEG
jgi:hypothetical protein